MILQIQVQQLTESIWSVTRVQELRKKVFKYDLLARVVLDGDSLHYVELTYWEKGEQKWLRRPRGYQLFDGAERVASDYALGKGQG